MHLSHPFAKEERSCKFNPAPATLLLADLRLSFERCVQTRLVPRFPYSAVFYGKINVFNATLGQDRFLKCIWEQHESISFIYSIISISFNVAFQIIPCSITDFVV